MQVLIHCFSGTGNTKICAERVASGLLGHGYHTTIHDMEEGITVKTADLHIIMFPIYATAAPHIVARYLRSLLDGKGARAVVLTTNGRISTRLRDGYQGWALQQARLLLGWKHYDAFFSDTFDFPHNVTAFGPPCSTDHNRQITDMAFEKLDAAIVKIAAGETYHRKYFLPNILWCLPFGLLLSLFGRRLIGKFYAPTPECSGCGLCAKKCPARTIRLHRGKPRWGWRCEGCMRCVNICPKRSIQVSLLRLAALIFVSVWNPLTMLFPGFYHAIAQSFGIIGSWFVNFAIFLIAFVLLFTVLDWLIYAMAFIPGLNWFSSWGHTMLYGRYDGFQYRTKGKRPSL